MIKLFSAWWTDTFRCWGIVWEGLWIPQSRTNAGGSNTANGLEFSMHSINILDLLSLWRGKKRTGLVNNNQLLIKMSYSIFLENFHVFKWGGTLTFTLLAFLHLEKTVWENSKNKRKPVVSSEPTICNYEISWHSFQCGHYINFIYGFCWESVSLDIFQPGQL